MATRLYRSRHSKIIGGVAGGIADYFNIDPTFIRLAFVLITPMWGASLLAYIILWIITPLEPLIVPENQNEGDLYRPDLQRQKNDGRGKTVFGYILIVIGVFGLAHRFVPHFDFSVFFPFLLIIIGGYIALTSIKKDEKNCEGGDYEN